jgi:phosphoribosyl 1,2-cyclic phosphate phosphodiesterase
MSQARVTILGCGTSTGVPVLGCACAVCQSSDPKNKRFRTAAVIRLPNSQQVLIDTSADLRSQALAFGLTYVDAVLYTHAHADHIMGMDDLRCFNFTKRGPIPCFGSAPTLEVLRRTFPYIFEQDPNYEGGLLPQLTLHEIAAGTPVEVCGYSFLPFGLQHARLEVLGFRLGNFAYATDCKVMPEATKAALQGVEVLILDGLRYEPHRTHLTISEAVALATELKVPRTYLTHMTHTVDFESVSRELPPHVQLAYDGLEITISLS